MKLVVVFVLLFCAVHGLLEEYPFGDPMCSKRGFSQYDKTSAYKQGVSVTTRLCARNYYSVCATVDGLKKCDKRHSKCVTVNYDWGNAALYPVSASRMATEPEVCASRGAFWHPETAVLAVAQPVCTFITFVLALTFTCMYARPKLSAFVVVVVSLIGLMCTLLMFSFFYLNAIVGILVTCAAVGCYATKSRSAVGIGMFLLVTALFWFTYRPGLGAIQHHMRLADGANFDSYQGVCDNYYRGYFAYPSELHNTWVNPEYTTNGYCLREWIAAEYFFMILLELLITLLVGLGAWSMNDAASS